jgi:ABC-type uncharacterized transport system auxiliary subunit
VKTGVSQSKGWKNSAWRLKAAGLVLLAPLIYAACGSAPKTRYYTLHVPPPPGASSPKTHFVLQVERFEAPDVLRDNRIIYYTSPTELNFHQYHRWSSDPAELLSELAMKFFAEAGLFQQVYAYPAPAETDYTLRGRVLNLGEMKYEKNGSGKSREARLGLKLDLLQTQQNKVVWSARLERAAPIEGNGVRGVVDALNNAADSLLQNAYSGISQVVEYEFAQKQEQAH